MTHCCTKVDRKPHTFFFFGVLCVFLGGGAQAAGGWAASKPGGASRGGCGGRQRGDVGAAARGETHPRDERAAHFESERRARAHRDADCPPRRGPAPGRRHGKPFGERWHLRSRAMHGCLRPPHSAGGRPMEPAAPRNAPSRRSAPG